MPTTPFSDVEEKHLITYQECQFCSCDLSPTSLEIIVFIKSLYQTWENSVTFKVWCDVSEI
jgi:hypothetical protein